MKQGRSLMELVSELERQRNMRKDYIADTRNLEISTDENSIILDSFAGSGTTAHAVLNLNKQDGGNRKFILIEMEIMPKLLLLKE